MSVGKLAFNVLSSHFLGSWKYGLKLLIEPEKRVKNTGLLFSSLLFNGIISDLIDTCLDASDVNNSFSISPIASAATTAFYLKQQNLFGMDSMTLVSSTYNSISLPTNIFGLYSVPTTHPVHQIFPQQQITLPYLQQQNPVFLVSSFLPVLNYELKLKQQQPLDLSHLQGMNLIIFS